MLIKVLHTQEASGDGIHLETFIEGDICEMNEKLTRMFLRNGWGVEVNLEPHPRQPGRKAVTAPQRTAAKKPVAKAKPKTKPKA